MKQIKTFLYVFYKSLTSPRYYRDVVNAPTSFSIKYFLVLVLLVSLAVSAFKLAPAIPEMKSAINGFVNDALNLYPSDLVITSKDGNLSINQPEPYIIGMPDSVKQEQQDFENFIVFDSLGTLDDLEKYKTVVLVNSANILVKDTQNDKIEVYPLKEMPDGQISRVDLEKLVESSADFINILPYLAFSLGVLGILIYNFGFRLLYLVFIAVIIWVLAKIRDLDFDFGKSYRVAIHTLTLPLVLELLIDVFRINFDFPLWFMIVHFVYGVVVIIVLASLAAADKARDSLLK